MKKVCLISSFCDTQEKIDVLSGNLDIINQLGIDTILISPLFLPKEIVEKVSYFFITKDNPVLDWPTKSMYAWKDLNLGDRMIRITKTFGDYGWAGLFQVKKLSEIALTFEYDYFYHLIYDLKIDNVVLDGFSKNQECHIYASKRGEQIWNVGLHFMSFNRNNLQDFIKHIDLNNYLKNNYYDAFSWLSDLKRTFDYNIVDTPVEDKIFIYDGKDYLDVSNIENLKFFIEKNDEEQTSVKILFYENETPKHLNISVGDLNYNLTLEENFLIDLGFSKFDIKPVIIFYENNSYDITKIIRDIKHSTLNYLN